MTDFTRVFDQLAIDNPAPAQAVAGGMADADAAGKAIQVGKEAGVSPTIPDADLQGFMQDFKSRKAGATVARNPALQNYVNNSPLASKVSNDDYDNLDRASGSLNNYKQGGLMQSVPQFFDLMSHPQGRDRLLNALKNYPSEFIKGMIEPLMVPGKVAAGKIDLNTPEGIDEAINLGVFIGLGRLSKTPGNATPTPLHPKAEEHLANGEIPPAGIDKSIDDLHIAQNKVDAANLDKVMEDAQLSRTKERSPDSFADFAREHTDQTIGLNPQEISKLYESENKTPAPGDGLFGYIPDLQQRLADGLATGTEINIPLADYVAHTDPTVHAKVKDNIRFRDDGITKEEAKEITAFHGSGAEFEAFDTGMIGTGEGAQAYGYGHYLAENRKVAEDYQHALGNYTFNGKPIDESDPAHLAAWELFDGTKEAAISRLKQDKNLYAPDVAKKAIQILEEGKELPKVEFVPGQIYQAKIKRAPEEFLDWDKPFKELDSKIQEIFNKLLIEKGEVNPSNFGKGYGLDESSIGDAYKTIERYVKAEDISKALSEAGIAGIRYLDQGSRTKGEGTRNYVVFKDSDIEITHRNDQELLQKALDASEAATAIAKEIIKARDPLYLEPLFKDAKTVGITDTEFKRYSDKIEKSQQEILDRMIAAADRESRRKQSAEWKANEEKTRAKVEKQINSRPDVAADRYIRTGELPNGKNTGAIKLDKSMVEQMLGKNHHLGDLVGKDGANPDDLAMVFRFDSGLDMLKQLESYNRNRKDLGLGPKAYRDTLVKNHTDQEMKRMYGSLEANILEEARDIALNEYQADILADEVRILAKKAGGEFPLSKDEFKNLVQTQFDKMKVDQVPSYKDLQRAIGKGGRDAEKALLAGKFEDAFQAKQRQMYAVLQSKIVQKFEKTLNKVDRLVERFSDAEAGKRLDPDIVHYTRQLLKRFGIDAGDPPEGILLKPLEQLIDESNNQIAVADYILDPNFRKKMEKFTTQQFSDLHDSLQSLAHVAKENKMIDSAYGKAMIEDAVKSVTDELARFDLIEQPLNPSIRQRAGNVGRMITAAHTLPERMLDYIDQYNPDGPLNRYLDRPFRESYAKELRLTEDVVAKLKKLQDYVDSSLADRLPNDIIPNPLSDAGLMDMTRRNLRQLMLNLGNASNASKLAEGFKLTEKQLYEYVKQHAKENDWKWVQGIWDIYKDLKAEADQMEMRYSGVPSETIRARSIDTPFGKFEGGFINMIYDRMRSNFEQDTRSSIFDNDYVSASTPHAYTRRRTNYAAAVDLEGNFLWSKLQGMVHDIAFREAVANADKLIRNPEFQLEMTKKWGPENTKQLTGWLKDIANVHGVDEAYAKGFQRFLAGFRQNVVSALTWVNPGTYIKHTGTAQAMSIYRTGVAPFLEAQKDLGLKSLVQTGKDLVKSDIKPRPSPDEVQMLRDLTSESDRGESLRQFILDSSPFMRNRQRQYSDTIRGAYEDATQQGVWKNIKDLRQMSITIGRTPVALGDALSAMPTWLAAYRAEFAKSGDFNKAVFVADKEVSRTHGSNFIGDKPSILRLKNSFQSEIARFVTPLYNFWNHMANITLTAAWDLQAMKQGRAEPNANIRQMAKTAALFGTAIMIEELASPALDEHNESFGMKTAKALTRFFGGQVIGLRDITNALAGGYEPSVGTFGTIMKSLHNLGVDISRIGTGRAARKDWAADVAMGAGMAGFGGPQIGKTLGFMSDVFTGKDRPRTFNEWRQGLRTGHSKPRIMH